LVDQTTVSNRGAIKITRRHRAWTDGLRQYDVLIDDEPVGAVHDRESSTYPVRAGLHKVQLRVARHRSEALKVDVAAGDTVVLECRARNRLAYPGDMIYGHPRYIEFRVVDAS
jgi:hypothetical protein